MIWSIAKDDPLSSLLDECGLGDALKEGGSALIKVNLARPPEPGHPRTDPALLADLIGYVTQHGARCAIAEGADGFLQENLEHIGLGRAVAAHDVRVLDLDREPFDPVSVADGEIHYLPRCLRDYALRIGCPATSKRPGMIYSNNVKLFVGAVPRHIYQVGEPTASRPGVHVDLHRSVANIYRAVMDYAPFLFYLNGGRAMVEGRGEIVLDRVLAGDDALELDRYFLDRFGLEAPGYIERLSRLNR
jgi:uncharacterized protein (DUF362 family)